MVLSMERWSGKVAVVTGASVGIGEAIAEQLVDHGLIVIGIARRAEMIEEKSKKLKGKPGVLHALKCDMSQPDEVIATFQKIGKDYGPIHILINNAAILHNTKLMDGDLQKWKESIDTNLLGVCVATKEAIADMKKNGVVGHIINMNSVAGHKIPASDLNMYYVTKHGITAMTETLRLELIQVGSKIKTTSISPGLTQTEIFNSAGFEVPLLKTFAPLKSEDVADAVVYALSTPPHVEIQELTVKPIGEPY